MINYLRKIKRKSFRLIKLCFFSFNYYLRRSLGLKKIEVINLNAIDVCNSKCQMCNIWKQKVDAKKTPEEFGEILNNKLFKDVKHVGVTGGEPTLRDDILELYRAIIDSLKNLEGLSIISNGIKSSSVKEKIKDISKLCKSRGISFGAMISLDGYKSKHDEIRGIPGNFESSIEVIKDLKNEGIPVSIGCTISKGNVFDVEDLLYFLRKEKIYGRFRIAEFIERLYNNDRGDVIRAFSEDEKYQLAIFFHKLELTFEKHEIYKRTYRNIRYMLLGGNRKIGCPYHSQGVVLNANGEISYCSPKSPVLGDASNMSADLIYQENLSTRKKILKENCSSCIHDYHYPLLIDEFFTEKLKKLQRKIFLTRNLRLAELFVSGLSFVLPKQKKSRKVVIVGWYGTETVGDKAILGGILEGIKREGENFELVIGSINPYITERTLVEMEIFGKVVDSKSLSLFNEIRTSTEVIMGGGPLMSIEELMIPYLSFLFAKKKRVKTIVYGCGIGPLDGDAKFEKIVNRILQVSDQVLLRDQDSVKKTEGIIEQSKVSMSGDPAKVYLKSPSFQAKLERLVDKEKKNELSLYLREWTYEYAKGIEKKDFFLKREQFERGLADYIKSVAKEKQVDSIRFWHMHNFVVGNDDRDFSIRFIDTYFADYEIPVSYDKGLSTIETICKSMMESKYCICMRFHSLLFADTLSASYEVIDYTLGGKIYNYLKDGKQLSRLVSFDSITKKGESIDPVSLSH